MEGLSAAASAIAVNSIKEAPEDIRAISADLKLLSSIFARIAYEAQHEEPDATLEDALQAGSVKVKELNTILNEIEPGFASTRLHLRKWTAFKAVLKRGQLMKFKKALEGLKSTLSLVQQNQISRLSRNRYISQEQILQAINQKISSLSLQRKSEIVARPPNPVLNIDPTCAAVTMEEWDAVEGGVGQLQSVQSEFSITDRSRQTPALVKRTIREESLVMKYFLCTIRARSNTILQTSKETDGSTPFCEENRYEHGTSYTIYPATWLIRRGFQYGLRLDFLSSSTQGWKNTIKAFCPVPDDSLIFEFSKEGDLPAVRSLMSRGHASVRDTDSQGYTPLHFAAENHHPELCKFLKGAGADTSAITYKAQTAIELAVWKKDFTTCTTISRAQNTLRLLHDSMDFFDENGSGWRVLTTLGYSCTRDGGGNEAKIALLLWMLKLSSSEMRISPAINHLANILKWMFIKPHPGLEQASNFLLNLGGAELIDAPIYLRNGYNVLQHLIGFGGESHGLYSVLSKGPDLYRLGVDHNFTPQEESPTSLSMYSSWAFWNWLNGLASIQVDLEEFLEQELERNHAVHAGWKKETLLDLFAYDNRTLDLELFWPCSDCVKIIYVVKIQPYWRHLIERIKQGLDPDNPAQACSEVDEKEDAGFESIAEAASSSSDVSLDDLGELPSASDEEDIHGYPATVSLRSDCLHAPNEVICMDCWVYYRKHGTRKQSQKRNQGFVTDVDEDSSEDDFSPFLIHS